MRTTLIAIASMASIATACGSGADEPMACIPAGVTVAPADVVGNGLSIGYSSTAIAAPDSDCSGLSIGCDTSVRLGVFPDSDDDPPASEIDVYVNGCAVGKLDDPGEEYFWTNQQGDTLAAPAPGTFVVVEATRFGEGVILRRSFAMPAVMPKLTSPASGAAISAPTRLEWQPLGIADLPDVMTAELSATAWRALGGGSAQTAGFTMLDDAAGAFDWQDGNANWTHLELQAQLTFVGGLSFYLNYFQPVND